MAPGVGGKWKAGGVGEDGGEGGADVGGEGWDHSFQGSGAMVGINFGC